MGSQDSLGVDPLWRSLVGWWLSLQQEVVMEVLVAAPGGMAEAVVKEMEAAMAATTVEELHLSSCWHLLLPFCRLQQRSLQT